MSRTFFGAPKYTALYAGNCHGSQNTDHNIHRPASCRHVTNATFFQDPTWEYRMFKSNVKIM